MSGGPNAIVVQPDCLSGLLANSLLTGKMHDVCFVKKDGGERWMRCRIDLDKLVEARLGVGTVITEGKKKMVQTSELPDLVAKGRVTLEEVLADGTQLRSFRFDSVTQWILDGDVYIRQNSHLPVDAESPQ